MKTNLSQHGPKPCPPARTKSGRPCRGNTTTELAPTAARLLAALAAVASFAAGCGDSEPAEKPLPAETSEAAADIAPVTEPSAASQPEPDKQQNADADPPGSEVEPETAADKSAELPEASVAEPVRLTEPPPMPPMPDMKDYENKKRLADIELDSEGMADMSLTVLRHAANTFSEKMAQWPQRWKRVEAAITLADSPPGEYFKFKSAWTWAPDGYDSLMAAQDRIMRDGYEKADWGYWGEYRHHAGDGTRWLAVRSLGGELRGCVSKTSSGQLSGGDCFDNEDDSVWRIKPDACAPSVDACFNRTTAWEDGDAAIRRACGEAGWDEPLVEDCVSLLTAPPVMAAALGGVHYLTPDGVATDSVICDYDPSVPDDPNVLDEDACNAMVRFTPLVAAGSGGQTPLGDLWVLMRSLPPAADGIVLVCRTFWDWADEINDRYETAGEQTRVARAHASVQWASC